MSRSRSKNVVWKVTTAAVVSVCAFTSASLLKEARLNFRRINVLTAKRQACKAGPEVPAHSPRKPSEQPVSPTATEERQDRIVPGQTYIGEHGVKLPAAFTRVRLEQVLPDGNLQPRRAGSRSVLAPKSVSVVNLWATYCSPCKDELPGFKRMFEQHAQWRSRVRFVPIQLPESRPPGTAYAKYGSRMPRSERFSDRMGGVVEALASPAKREQKLYYESLPVTLVLDCNRRVRWARFSALKPEHFTELTTTINKLVRELPTRKCQRVECGNNVCESGESEQKCPNDCREEFVDMPLDSEPDSSEEVNQARSKEANSTTLHKVSDTSPELPLDVGCNQNGRCDYGEKTTDCCRDCGCPEGLACRPGAGGLWQCGLGLQ